VFLCITSQYYTLSVLSSIVTLHSMLQIQQTNTFIYIRDIQRRKYQVRLSSREIIVKEKWLVNLIKDSRESKGER